MSQTVWIGRDPREHAAYAVCHRSLVERRSQLLPVTGISLDVLREAGLYWRQTERREGRLFDVISCAPMSTEFAISRFLTPILAHGGWAVFMDCDMLVRADIMELFALADPHYAVQVVKHDHRPTELRKMDGQVQTAYPCKNWSSVMLWNVEHPANRRLTLDFINSAPGRMLHSFCWLDEEEIGELPAEWNHLVGVNPPNPDAKIAHFTLGTPDMLGYEESEFADEWFDYTTSGGRFWTKPESRVA